MSTTTTEPKVQSYPAGHVPLLSIEDYVSPSCTKTAMAICVPVFNDWPSVLILLKRLDEVVSEFDFPVHVILVDDCSTDSPPAIPHASMRSLLRVDILTLQANLGHQRAIALGLAFIYKHSSCHLVVVMDCDGEDNPKDVPTLVDKCKRTEFSTLIFAARRKRTEGVIFRVGYTLYKLLHRIVTGRGMNVGNFSVIPAGRLGAVLAMPELWNHYAASVWHSRLPVDKVPVYRAKRLAGRSKLNLYRLVAHGMSSMSVYGDVVGARLLVMTCLMAFVLVAMLVGVIFIRLCTDMAIPGWATNTIGLISLMLMNLFSLTVIVGLLALQVRSIARCIPLRDWRYYVAGWNTLYERPEV